MSATVSLIPLSDYSSSEKTEQALTAALAPWGGMGHFVHNGDRVLLKANLLAPAKPEEAVTTHPEIVRAAIRACRKAGAAAVLVGDGPGVGTSLDNARICGISQVCQEEGAEVVDFGATAIYDNPENTIGKRLELTVHLKNIDVLITLPKLKTHVQMGYTGAIKNQYGLIPGTRKAEYHFRLQNRDHFCDLVIDINRTAKVALAIMDAVVGMEGPGPHGGTPRHIGAIIAGDDLSAVDCVACQIIGLQPEKHPLLQAACRNRYGTWNPGEIAINGSKISDFAIPDYKLVQHTVNLLKLIPLPQWALKWLRKQLADRPYIDASKCIKCMKCHNGCPVKPAAIDPRKTDGGVNADTCIRCYCCHEFCPANAIELRKSMLERLFHIRQFCGFCSRSLGKIAGKFKK